MVRAPYWVALTWVLTGATLFLTGCAATPEVAAADSTELAAPQAMDPAARGEIAGSWRSSDRKVLMALNEDGTFRITTNVAFSAMGSGTKQVEGSEEGTWKAADRKLSMNYPTKGYQTVYGYTVDAGQLKLTRNNRGKAYTYTKE